MMFSRNLAHGVTAAVALLATAPIPANAQPAPPPAAAPVDPARLEAARTAVNAIYSDEANAQVLGQAVATAVDRTVATIEQLPLRELAVLGIVNPRQFALIDDAGKREIMAIFDPVHEQRAKAIRQVLGPELAKLAGQSAPLIREGMALAYARRFSAAQLADLNRFLATPSGKAFAAQSMLIQADPEVTSRTQQAMGNLRSGLAGTLEKLNQATAQLPKPRRYVDLGEAEKARLAALLGMTPASLDAQIKARAPK